MLTFSLACCWLCCYLDWSVGWGYDWIKFVFGCSLTYVWRATSDCYHWCRIGQFWMYWSNLLPCGVLLLKQVWENDLRRVKASTRSYLVFKRCQTYSWRPFIVWLGLMNPVGLQSCWSPSSKSIVYQGVKSLTGAREAIFSLEKSLGHRLQQLIEGKSLLLFGLKWSALGRVCLIASTWVKDG